MSDDDVKYLRGKVDRLVEGLATTNVILERNTASLEEHVRRTNLLESQVSTVEGRVKPLEVFVNGIKFVGKAVLAVVPALALAHALGLL
jgi:hypothetical protein